MKYNSIFIKLGTTGIKLFTITCCFRNTTETFACNAQVAAFCTPNGYKCSKIGQ